MSVNCSVKTCVHNDEFGKCKANTIIIRGVSATQFNDTLCKSYIEKTAKSFIEEFAKEMNETVKSANVMDIRCSAIRCRHNLANRCHAKVVQIQKETAACHTFLK